MIVAGQVDANGCLISADLPLLALHLGAGGVSGGAVAVPQIATLARLARNLGILVSRPVVAADGHRVLDLLVRAKLEQDIVHIAITEWNERGTTIPDPDSVKAAGFDFARLESDGAWETDRMLRITKLSPGINVEFGSVARTAPGKPLTALFALKPDEFGALPILVAMAERARFVDQAAEFIGSPMGSVLLSGEPVFDSGGQFSGLHGQINRIANAPSVVPQTKPEDGIMHGIYAAKLDDALRAPISNIIANADDIAAQNDGPLRHDYVDYASDISNAGRHLLGLVDDLGDLQSIESNDFHVALEAVDLTDVARRAAGLLAVRAADQGVRIDMPDADEVLPAVGEFRRVLQILVNLIGNAVRYSPQGAMVWIRSEEESDLAAIVIADQGKGIAAEDHERIFEKFGRVDPSEPGGSGLGLYIARKLARAMGGDINVDSAPGQGARFVLTLPKQ